MIGEEIILKCFKLIFKQNPFAQISGLSNEVLCTLVAQEATELPSVKFGDLEKYPAVRPDLHHSSAAQVQVPDLFFVPPILTYGSLANPLATSAKITSFESPMREQLDLA